MANLYLLPHFDFNNGSKGTQQQCCNAVLEGIKKLHFAGVDQAGEGCVEVVSVVLWSQ